MELDGSQAKMEFRMKSGSDKLMMGMLVFRNPEVLTEMEPGSQAEMELRMQSWMKLEMVRDKNGNNLESYWEGSCHGTERRHGKKW